MPWQLLSATAVGSEPATPRAAILGGSRCSGHPLVDHRRKARVTACSWPNAQVRRFARSVVRAAIRVWIALGGCDHAIATVRHVPRETRLLDGSERPDAESIECLAFKSGRLGRRTERYSRSSTSFVAGSSHASSARSQGTIVVGTASGSKRPSANNSSTTGSRRRESALDK